MSKYTPDEVVCLATGCDNRFVPYSRRYGTDYKGHYCPEHDGVDKMPGDEDDTETEET